MLLSQQAQLVRLDERRAVVRVSGTWMAMVQSRLPLLEKAVASALGGARQLLLESGGEPPAGDDRPAATAASAKPVSAPAMTAPAMTAPAASAPAVVPNPLPAHAEAAMPPERPPIPPPPPVPPPALPPPPVPPPAGRSPLEERAQRLADFFNGDVIEGLEDEVA
jgi:DNA polymerase-3 subunit gamma/tau